MANNTPGNTPGNTTKSGTVKNDDHCFCCGTKNDRGFGLHFSYPEAGKAQTTLLVPDFCTGWENLTHGGFISMLLDETMAHACISRGVEGVTAELTVRFKKPLPVGTDIEITAEAEEKKGRILGTQGWIKDKEGKLYAAATARFMVSG